jgi:AcrR family transcriptional regulator
MARKSAPPPDLLALAFEQIAEQGWAGLSLVSLARRAGVPPVEVYGQLPNRQAILRALSDRVDQAMLAVDQRELEDLPARDRLFELVMRRLEAMAPFRAGLARLARDARREPCVLLATFCRLDRSLRWMQELAGLRSHGLRARLQRRALLAVYAQTLQVWFGEQSDDLAKSMAELDKQLRRIESLVGLRARRATTDPGEQAQPA